MQTRAYDSIYKPCFGTSFVWYFFGAANRMYKVTSFKRQSKTIIYRNWDSLPIALYGGFWTRSGIRGDTLTRPKCTDKVVLNAVPRGKCYATKAWGRNIWNVTKNMFKPFGTSKSNLHSQTEKSMTACEQSLSPAPSDPGKWMERPGCYQQGYQIPSESDG